MPRYPYYPGVANPSLTAGMFTDPAELHVDARNLSDAGQYGIAAPTVPSGYDHTWNNYDRPAVYQDPRQRAAASYRGTRGAAAEAEPAVDRDALLSLRRLTDYGLQNPENEGRSRYDVFASQPQNLNRFAPEIQRDYASIYGNTPEGEMKLRGAEALNRLRMAKLAEEPQNAMFARHQATAKELGLPLGQFLEALEALPVEERRPGRVVNLRSRYVPDKNTGEPVEVKGAPIVLSPRHLRMAEEIQREQSRYIPQTRGPLQYEVADMDARDRMRMGASSMIRENAAANLDEAPELAELQALRTRKQAELDARSKAAASFSYQHPARTRIR